MLLRDKTAIVHGAGGAIGGAVARAFAAEGARVHLCGRNLATIAPVARDIAAAGGVAREAEVDALDAAAVERHAAAVAADGGIDVVFNAVGFAVVQGTPLVDIAPADFAHPITTWTMTQFLTARAAARHMAARGSGVVLLLSASPARLAIGLTGGFAVACAAVEGLSRTLAAEMGPQGVRVVCIRSHRVGETLGDGADFPMPPAEFVRFLEDMTLLKRLPTLDDLARTAVFLASDHAAGMTGAVANLTGGMSPD